MDILRDKTVTTAKDHSCFWCGEPIPAKSKAQARSWLYEGELYSGHTHIECYEAWKSISHNSALIPPDGFKEYGQVRGTKLTLDDLSREACSLEMAWKQFIGEVGVEDAAQWLLSKLKFFGNYYEGEHNGE